MAIETNLVFVHGWSVTNTSTYGQLPIRLREEGKANGININITNIYLGEYISFHDEVRLRDISKAFDYAVRSVMADVIKAGKRFIAITHSTGGPVMRDWAFRYKDAWGTLPMSHLIMLAPANFGSALAQLGKKRIGRLKSWFEALLEGDNFLNDREPGQGILDWLELGSRESWEVNEKWIKSNREDFLKNYYYPFVLTGQSIDRKFYDNLNTYTGELGSDGVVRAAAANLNATYIKLQQQLANSADNLFAEQIQSPATAFRIVRKASHSGTDMGIMNAPKAAVNDPLGKDTVDSIIKCIKVRSAADYDKLTAEFVQETAKVQADEKVEEINKGVLSLSKRTIIHDRYCMLVFRVKDTQGYAVTDYDLIFTFGKEDNPNHLPEGFFVDRQKNNLSKETISYYLNYDVIKSVDKPGIEEGLLGLVIMPRPSAGFVRYTSFKLKASDAFFNAVVKPNATTLIDICLQRNVDENVFVLKGPVPMMPTEKKDMYFGDRDPSGKDTK